MMKQVFISLQPVEDHIGADAHTTAQGGPDAGAGGCALKEPAACGGHMLERIFPEELQPMLKTHARAVCKGLRPVGRTHARAG